MNLTEYYCNLVKQNLNHIISIIMPGTHPEYRKGIDIYIDLYIKVRYFHEPETVPKEELESFDFQTVIREFNGKRIELLYEYKKQDQEKYAKFVEDAYTAVATAVLLDEFQTDLITPDNMKKVVDDAIPILLSDESIKKVCNQILKNRALESKFLTGIVSDQFYLKYEPFRFKKTYFKVELYEKIKELDPYSIRQIVKNMKREPVSSLATETLLNLLNMDMISLMKANEDLAHYFIAMPSTLLKEENQLEEILKMTSFSLTKKHLTWLITEEDYLENKEVVTKISKRNALALVLDVQGIEDLESKLEECLTLLEFDSIVCKNANKEQYTKITKYSKLVTKPIFTDELVKE